jgi:hypothetical protein
MVLLTIGVSAMKKPEKGKKPEERRRKRHDTTPADWGGADSGVLRETIEAVTKDGGAIRFGYSSDGGAYSIGIYGDGKPFTEYLSGAGDVDAWLEGFKLDYE